MKPSSKILMGLSLFFILCVGGLYFALQAWMPFMAILLVSAGVGIVVVAVRERRLLGQLATLKTTKHGLNMGSALILTFCLLVIFNYFSIKFVHVFDLSMTSQYTLSDQSRKVIDGLDADLEVKYFFKEGLQNADLSKKNFLSMVKVFETYSAKVKVSLVEMNAHPALTETYGAKQGAGEGFISYKGKINRIESQSLNRSGTIYTEQDFTNAIIKSTREKFKSIYFLSGHGERDTENEKDENSLSLFKNALEKNSYKVGNLNLIQNGSMPSEIDLLIIAGPTQRFQKSEIALIDAYLKTGKPILAFGENYLLDEVSWRIGPEFIFNILTTPEGPIVSTDQPTVANVFSEESDITKLFKNNRSVLFFRPHPLIANPTLVSTGFSHQVLLRTSDKAVGITKIDSTQYEGQPRSFDLAVHLTGKYQASPHTTDIVLVSDPHVASNQFFNQSSNKDFLLNSVSYLAKETDLVSLTPKEPSVTKLKMPNPEFNTFFKYTIVGLFFPLPVIFLGFSIFMWYRRRHA